MESETLLPIGKVDPGLRDASLRLDLLQVPAMAREAEEIGYDGIASGETKNDPCAPLLLAATSTERARLTTAVLIAFPRSPTATAMIAWDLQAMSKGRFVLGLGPQVKGHIERRYGMPWAAPLPRMRDYILAVRAVWNSWQNRVPLDFHSEHYNLSLMVPLFDPGPIDYPDIPMQIAAVNKGMCRLAGELCQGLRPHPICTTKYISEVMLPAIREGAAKAGRDLTGFDVVPSPLIATGPTRAAVEERNPRRPRARRLLRLDAHLRRGVPPPRVGRARGRAPRVLGAEALGGDAEADQRRDAPHDRGGRHARRDSRQAARALRRRRHRARVGDADPHAGRPRDAQGGDPGAASLTDRPGMGCPARAAYGNHARFRISVSFLYGAKYLNKNENG